MLMASGGTMRFRKTLLFLLSKRPTLQSLW